MSCPRTARYFSVFHQKSTFAHPIEWVLYGSFLQGKRSHGVRLVTYLHLVAGSRIRGSIPQPHLYAFMACTVTTILLPFILRCGGVSIIWYIKHNNMNFGVASAFSNLIYMPTVICRRPEFKIGAAKHQV